MHKTKVSEICQPCSIALTVKESDGIEAAIRRFAQEQDTHTIFVIDTKGKLKGSVRLKDILDWVRLKLGIGQEQQRLTRGVETFEAFQFLRLAESTKIGDIVSSAASVNTDDTLAHAINVMAEAKVVEVAVVDNGGNLLGEVKLTKVLAKLLDICDSCEIE
jgi:CBS-domain-containing membrane protein